jgi:malonyl CoA-acyl carrier protein transacylase
MRAFLFPGQGSQAVGMGAALAGASRTARDVFDEVDQALGQNLFRLMRDGPEDELKAHRKCATRDHGAFDRGASCLGYSIA